MKINRVEFWGWSFLFLLGFGMGTLFPSWLWGPCVLLAFVCLWRCAVNDKAERGGES